MQNARMYEVLEEQATTDGLTGLVNHRTFQERFSTMLGRAERHELPVSLLLTDIDHFKKINDSYGHPTGDEVLRRVAAILKASARKIDIVARYGGEEFALVLEGDRPRRRAPAGRAHPPGGRAAVVPVVEGAVQRDAVDRRRQLPRRLARQARDHRARRPGALQPPSTAAATAPSASATSTASSRSPRRSEAGAWLARLACWRVGSRRAGARRNDLSRSISRACGPRSPTRSRWRKPAARRSRRRVPPWKV